MKIIILGGTGYLGSLMVHSLLKEGHDVLCIIRSESNLNRLSDIAEKITMCKIDDLDKRLNEQKYDWFLNFACKYSRDAPDEDVFEANYYNPLKLMIKCMKHDIDNIMTIDTGLVRNLNAYSFSKAMLADTLKWYCDQNEKLTVYNIKLENYYGKDEPSDRFLPQTINKLRKNEKILLTDGRQIRDFIYVQDVVDNLKSLLIKEKRIGLYDIPLGTGKGVSIRELITYLKEIIGSESELCFGAIEKRKGEPDSVADADIMTIYDFNIKYDWKQGMKIITGV